jgi:hypothetical protein
MPKQIDKENGEIHLAIRCGTDRNYDAEVLH